MVPLELLSALKWHHLPHLKCFNVAAFTGPLGLYFSVDVSDIESSESQSGITWEESLNSFKQVDCIVEGMCQP